MNYYNEIKENLINNDIYKRVKDYSKNKSDLDTYYKVGKLLSEAGKHYGEGIIKEYSIRLIEEIDKKYSDRTLRRYRQFYILLNNQKWSPLATKLTWSHWVELLVIKDIEEIKYYIYICDIKNISRNELRSKIKFKEYERLPKDTKEKLINHDSVGIRDLIPNPIVIKKKNNIEVLNEKILHQLILENIESFMQELGTGYAFIGSEYKIKIGKEFNYIDLLLFNIKFNCYVVIELKVTKLQKEYFGQIDVYMNYIDLNIKELNQNKTIGIIICKKDDKFVIEYCTDKRILTREYQLIL
jgi:predicted nuclease of restriction endonuclease-like (RecB) superfamily